MKRILLLFCIIAGMAPLLMANTCYLAIKNQAPALESKMVEAVAVSIINRYVTTVEKIPLSGISMKACVYELDVNKAGQETIITLAGAKINSMGDSLQSGERGYRHALLRTIYRSQDDVSLKNRICQNYSTLMAEDCKPIQARVFLYDGEGKELVNGGQVRSGDQFNFMIESDTTAYAYVIGKDAGGSMFKIFPNPEVVPYGNPLSGGQAYSMPSLTSDFAFEFDKNIGLETFYVVVSPTPMKDIDQIFQQMDQASSQELQKLQKILDQRIRTRGFGIKKKKSTITIRPGTQSKFSGNKTGMVDLIRSQGGFTKIITLQHR